jgi:hypothetical protein
MAVLRLVLGILFLVGYFWLLIEPRASKIRNSGNWFVIWIISLIIMYIGIDLIFTALHDWKTL